jgi:hypothetical protein
VEENQEKAMAFRRRWVVRDGRLVELDLEAPLPPPVAPMIRSDISPYRSVKTGEMITGRAQHREHLQRHGMIEVGNERAPFFNRPAAGPPPGDIASDIKQQLARDPVERRSEATRVLNQAGYSGPQVERILKS